MVGAWSSVWTVPSYGLTQEYWVAQMEALDPDLQINSIDLVNIMPFDCAVQYLKLICPTYLRPCTVPGNGSLIDLAPAIPLSVCRSVCQEFNDVCESFFIGNGFPAFNCSRLDPLTGGELYPIDSDDSPLGCARIENDELGNSSYPCPPPFLNYAEEYGTNNPNWGLPCAPTCHESVYLMMDKGNEHAMFVTFSVLSWVSMVSVLVTMAVFIAIPRLREFPSRLVIYCGFGLFWLHIGGVGNSFYDYPHLLCRDLWHLQFGSWCKFSAWSLIFGAMYTSWWWTYQSFVVFWNVALRRFRNPLPEKLEIPVHVASFCYSLLTAFILSFVPNETSTGGSFFSNPLCAFNTGMLLELEWSMLMGVLILFILLVAIFLGLSAVEILRTPYAQGNWLKAFGSRLPHQLSIMAFCLCYINVIVSVLAQLSWSRDNHSLTAAAIADYIVCTLTTLGIPEHCHNEHRGNTSIYWYLTISISSIGFFYSVVFLVLKTQTRQLVWATLTGAVVSSITSSKAARIDSRTEGPSSRIDSNET